MNEIIAEDALQEQLHADTSRKREKQIKKLIKRYEDTIFSFFRELNLPLKFREIIRAYIVASDGNTFFDASHTDLTNILFRRSATGFRANRERVRSNVRALQKWQEEKGVLLIRVIEEGNKKVVDGKPEYLKTKYELVLLNELVKVLYNCPSNEIKARVKEIVARMKEINVPENSKKTPIKYLMQRNRSTIFSIFGKVLVQAKELNLDPVKVGEHLLSELETTLSEMAQTSIEKQSRERRISEFMQDSNVQNINTYENEGMGNSHTHSLVNLDKNSPSDNRTFSLSMEREIESPSTFLNSAIRENESDNSLLDAALNYAKAGYYVFPLQNLVIENNSVRCSCRDWKSCNKQGKHPHTWHGLLDASTNLDTIKNWWSKRPNANVGLITGKKSGIFVLDIDLNKGGEHSLNDLQDSYGELSPTLTAISGSGGRHLIFKYPNDVKLKNSVSLIAPGLDIKSDNGYIVAAPSSHISGGRYQWHGVNTPILDAPDWLVALILLAEDEAKRDKKVESIAFDYSTALVSTEIIKEGQDFNTASGKSRGRHDYLFRYASGLVMSHSPEQVIAKVQARNLARCVPPLDYEDVVKQVESAERYRYKQKAA
jgi:bifunctional DNA primase/polymerase-like protein